MSTLKVDQVSKLFRATSRAGGLTPALRKVSFELNQGEVISLIGESGSGKTTIGKVILRLVQPTSGTVTFDGTDIASYSQRGLRDYYRHVQGVFQDPFSSYNPIYRADRVFELVRDVYFRHVSDKDWHHKIEAALDAVTLNPGDVLGKYPHQLSGGQQQRLLIARALLLEVKVRVADEIISMLDASTREGIRLTIDAVGIEDEPPALRRTVVDQGRNVLSNQRTAVQTDRAQACHVGTKPVDSMPVAPQGTITFAQRTLAADGDLAKRIREVFQWNPEFLLPEIPVALCIEGAIPG